MKRTFRALAVVAIVAAPLAGCAPHLKKLDNATRGPYRYANPNGVSLPEQPVPSVEDIAPQTPVPLAPAQETPPAPALPYSVPAPDPAAPPPAPKAEGTDGATVPPSTSHPSGSR